MPRFAPARRRRRQSRLFAHQLRRSGKEVKNRLDGWIWLAATMKNRTATQSDEPSVLHEHTVTSKERLDQWLDDALADTFPASDPVASPPSETTSVERPRPASKQSAASSGRIITKH